MRLLLHEDEERKPMGQPKRGRYGSVDGKGAGAIGGTLGTPAYISEKTVNNANVNSS